MIAVFILAVYLLIVVLKGNAYKLFELMKNTSIILFRFLVALVLTLILLQLPIFNVLIPMVLNIAVIVYAVRYSSQVATLINYFKALMGV
ncbi:MAG TPA: hypothetical protein ENO40_04475 [Desulfurella acetivorans]|nr:hypothetical protein [Desulfurella acetivorans]